MKEPERQDPPVRGLPDETVWALMKDLIAVSRAQARLTAHLVEMIERLARPEPVLRQEPAVTAEPVARPEPSPRLEPEPLEEMVVDDAAPAAGNGRADAADALAEGPDEPEELEGESEMVLVLESGDVRVGVLWDQVVQIGSLSTSAVPERISTDRGEVELASLGLLLHGVSREEKYFVILDQEGERAGVACERMLGLGPIESAAKQEKDAQIQVLKVPMLRTFSGVRKTPRDAGRPAPQVTRTPEEQDRQGPLRALVAVRYLPARVAICRHLRGRGWQVGEAAGLEAATVSLDLGRWDALFLEARGNGETDDIEKTLLRRVVECRVPVVRVGSRISGYPGHEGPALMFPFSETELDAILIQAGKRVEA